MKYRQRLIFDAFLYQGQYTNGCPEWSRAYVTVNKNNLPKNVYIVLGVDKGCHIVPREAFEALYEEMKEEVVEKMIPSEGIEDPNMLGAA